MRTRSPSPSQHGGVNPRGPAGAGRHVRHTDHDPGRRPGRHLGASVVRRREAKAVGRSHVPCATSAGRRRGRAGHGVAAWIGAADGHAHRPAPAKAGQDETMVSESDDPPTAYFSKVPFLARALPALPALKLVALEHPHGGDAYPPRVSHARTRTNSHFRTAPPPPVPPLCRRLPLQRRPGGVDGPHRRGLNGGTVKRGGTGSVRPPSRHLCLWALVPFAHNTAIL